MIAGTRAVLGVAGQAETDPGCSADALVRCGGGRADFADWGIGHGDL